jgi:5-methylcytosine-specific restriction enzyme B
VTEVALATGRSRLKRGARLGGMQEGVPKRLASGCAVIRLQCYGGCGRAFAYASRIAETRPVTASEPEFYAQLDERRPGLGAKLRGFLESVASLGVTGEFRASCVLRWSAGPDSDGRAGFIEKTGKVWLSGAHTSAKLRGVADAGLRYLETVATEIGGSVRRYERASAEVMDATGHVPDLTLMLEHADGWRRAIATLIDGPARSTTTTFHFDSSGGRETVPDSLGIRMIEPTNLILYGPPGTGKTYRTALEAVRLCDGTHPEDRTELMLRYQELKRDGRIEFVTFHQSFSYEDFVEGLRPQAGGEGAGGIGFSLEPESGVFRKMAELADQARRAASEPRIAAGIDLSNRTFWKISLGASGVEEQVYDAAIAGNYVVLGWGGNEDWSDPIYDDIEAVQRKWDEVGPPDSHSSNVRQLWPFRSKMRVGDIVIVPFGNSAFRAVGEVTGEYEYAPTGEATYNHRRVVRWLLVLDKPLPVDSILDGNFTMRAFYQIPRRRIRMEALSTLLIGPATSHDGGAGEPPAYVLIIDEINRANISKVFGELITLLEPDKRLGAPNELVVKLPYSRDSFGVPSNLHVVGTMNTADRSIALLDTALRRRFQFTEMMPDPELLADAKSATAIDLVALLRVMNRRIEYLFDREHQIGHAFFMNCMTRADVDGAMRHKVIPLLQEYFFEDWSRLASVLGEREGVRDGAFLRYEKIAPPPGIDGDDRSRWTVRDEFAADAYQRLIGSGSATASASDQGLDEIEPALDE